LNTDIENPDYEKLLEELKKSSAIKNELFEKNKKAKEEFDRLKNIFTNTVYI